jgi:predicted metal-dependent hydrolase
MRRKTIRKIILDMLGVRVVRRRRTKGLKATYLKNKAKTLEIVNKKLKQFNLVYNFKYNRVTIRNQSSRWGSCSTHGNLNFNYRLGLIGDRLADYVVVHELCHLGEFNHSKDFWKLVERTIPDYESRRRELMKINTSNLKLQ